MMQNKHIIMYSLRAYKAPFCYLDKEHSNRITKKEWCILRPQVYDKNRTIKKQSLSEVRFVWGSFNLSFWIISEFYNGELNARNSFQKSFSLYISNLIYMNSLSTRKCKNIINWYHKWKPEKFNQHFENFYITAVLSEYADVHLRRWSVLNI